MKALFKVTYTPFHDESEADSDLDLNNTPYGTATVIATDVEDVIDKVNKEFVGEVIEIEDSIDDQEIICKKVVFHSIEIISVVDIE